MGSVITLGIESATTTVGVALCGDDGVLASVEINHGRRHAETLAPAIQFVCRHAQIALTDIAAIAVDVGPGLFTGMRVGIATAKVMAQALQIPVVGVSSLDLLAYPFGSGTREADRVIVSVIDARKAEVFYAFYRSTSDGPRRLTDPRVGSVADLNADILGRGQDVTAVGDGAWRYREDLLGGVLIAELAHPSAVSLVQLARPIFAGIDDNARTLVDVQPMYLRAPDAQINWTSR